MRLVGRFSEPRHQRLIEVRRDGQRVLDRACTFGHETGQDRVDGRATQ